MKLRDKIAASVARAINVNPEKKDRVVKRLKLYEKLGKLGPPLPRRGYERICYDADGVPLEIYRRKRTEPKKLVLIVHGGVFIMGLTNIYRNMHSAICEAVGDVAVAVVDYRVAPEHKYPAAHDDVRAGWEFIQRALGYKPRDILLMGDSSGGNLVLSLLLRLRDENRPMPAAAALMSPWTDISAAGASYKSNYCRDVVFGRGGSAPGEAKIRKLLECGVFSYADGADRGDPYLSPVLGEYHGMPPILMAAGSNEMLLDDTLAVSERIKAAGGSVKVIIGDGMFHAYPLFHRISPTAKETFKEILSFLKEHVHT
ncbi:MAG: alpha/beta hydrolase [Clostridiales bacterium]|jgi:acetyl esterase/lipase|nr:alpha/beta hydrolase [Clostridiales bacterium]